MYLDKLRRKAQNIHRINGFIRVPAVPLSFPEKRLFAVTYGSGARVASAGYSLCLSEISDKHRYPNFNIITTFYCKYLKYNG